ncbi:Armadillo-like helical domain and Armadillo-type fold domain-containing protein [Strongyloides ratti]|uniref:Armadillo-like helical domain and Armadillo-type fold domain-containing protein n=1 Tax=Strongyloides ratti TaxID=34506 RepID=A0A090MYJ0_STRRB|nr:Armadillo-like helical domain and Armadillo-type fold domain-containing protein [Strongyloides ratti]CEF67269.1 Armadillo-like helical domain and Armadillo-type fold domain-containing protein [Strongyloides ratti]
MDPYNQFINTSLMSNYINQPGQVTSSTSLTIDPDKSIYGGYLYPQETSYYQQTLKPINYPPEYNLTSLTNAYQQSVNGNCLSNNKNFQTQQWMQNHYFDPNIYSLSTPSCAPSTISNMSYTSITDNNPQSSCSTNTIENGRMTEIKSMFHDQSTTNSVVSCGENLDPGSNQLTEDCRNNILNNLLDDDIEVRKKGNQAKPFIIDIMNAINNDMASFTNLERLLECLCHLTYNSKTIGCIINSIIDNNLLFIDTLGKRIIKDKFNRYGCGYYALSILHAILSLSGDISKIFTKYTRKPFIMDRIFEYFEKILTLSSINLYNQICYFERKELIWLIDCLKNLIYENDYMKEYSLSKNGIQILLKIIKGSQREYIHYHSLSCINAFIQSGSIKYVIEFVKNDIIEVVFSIVTTFTPIDNNRKMGSERIIVECYKIFCSILDADKMESIAIQNISNIILNNLTKSSIHLSKYYTWFLCRLSSKKELKIEQKIDNSNLESEKIKNIEEIFDNCLITLKNLTYHSQEEKILKIGIEKLCSINGSIQILMNLFITSTFDINKSRIIIILLRGISFYKYNENHFQYLLDIIMKNIKDFIDIIFKRSKEFNKLKDISRKNLKDLLKKGIYFIKCLCLEYNGVSTKIREILRINKINLLKLIDDIKDVEIRSEVIQLAGVLLNREDNIVDKWLNNLQTQNTIKDCSESEDINLRKVTMEFLKLAQETRCYILVEESIECNGGISIASIYADM